jgi:CRP-like cAMP-binding protein
MHGHTDSEKRELLLKSLVFSQLSAEDLDQLGKFAKSKRVAAKEVIFHKAEPGNQMSLIVSGRVKLSTLSEEGKEMMFGILEAGELFGEIALLDGEERSAAVTAIEPTELLVIERRDFIPFLERHPKVAIKLLATLAARLRLTDEMFEDTLFRNLPSRLAKRFLSLATDYGQETSAGVQIKLKLSQGEIGNLVGTSRESVNKQIRAWEEQGFISFKKGYITIKDSAALEDLSELSL